ncbi:hypothetical protein MFIFM68171_06128 [Madurella fahalii]|uniref:Uncharacterized protein n=1 Tax=Madurella fahalii TaxID=1157608 RepID=A0ABQ0GDS4_9PEZI
MASFPQDDNIRSNKRPRHGDYNLAAFGGSGSAFGTPRNVEASDIIHPPVYDNANLVDHSYNYPGLFSNLIHDMDDDGNIAYPLQNFNNLYGDFPPEGSDDDALHYTHEQLATASATGGASSVERPIAEQQTIISPGLDTECSNSASSGTSLPPNPSRLTKAGPSAQEWEERKPLIAFLWGRDKPGLDLTLQELKQVMEMAGFLKG